MIKTAYAGNSLRQHDDQNSKQDFEYLRGFASAMN